MGFRSIMVERDCTILIDTICKKTKNIHFDIYMWSKKSLKPTFVTPR